MGYKKQLWGWLLVIVGFGLCVRTGVNIFRLWKLGERVENTQKQVTGAEAENQKLQAKLEYVKTPEFVEQEVRNKLGYGKEGETIVVVPEEEISKSETLSSKPEEANWKKWWKLYIGI